MTSRLNPGIQSPVAALQLPSIGGRISKLSSRGTTATFDRRLIVHLAGLIENGVQIQAGQEFPFGWDTYGQRMRYKASPELLRVAREYLAKRSRRATAVRAGA